MRGDRRIWDTFWIWEYLDKSLPSEHPWIPHIKFSEIWNSLDTMVHTEFCVRDAQLMQILLVWLVWYLCSVFQVWRHQNFRLYLLYQQWQQKKNKWFLAILASTWPCEHPVPGFLSISKTCPVGSPLGTPSQQRVQRWRTQTGGSTSFLGLWSLFSKLFILLFLHGIGLGWMS